MTKIKRKIQLSPSKRFYELWIQEGTKPFKKEKSGLNLEEALKESANIGYKNLWLDIFKKK